MMNETFFLILLQVELYITQLPPSPFHSSYLCLFGDQSRPLPARQTHTGLSCRTPALDERPQLPLGKGEYFKHDEFPFDT